MPCRRSAQCPAGTLPRSASRTRPPPTGPFPPPAEPAGCRARRCRSPEARIPSPPLPRPPPPGRGGAPARCGRRLHRVGGGESVDWLVGLFIVGGQPERHILIISSNRFGFEPAARC